MAGEMAAAALEASASFLNPKVTNPRFDQYPKQQAHDSLIQRGYMRLLPEAYGTLAEDMAGTVSGESALDALKKIGVKLTFQFNPNQLTRSVTARTDTQLWINQSPAMLLMPGIGDMSFGWQMLFNREAEVAKRSKMRYQRSADALERDNNELDDLSDPSDSSVAERIGVLADIMVLDQITGQKLTQGVIDYSLAYAAATSSMGEVDPNEAVMSTSQRNGLLDANMTNSAFMIPNPVRVVFSENFMVDGYVNQITVSIQKFSPEMIPTVAFVDISMHAIYQGFARKNTVFTMLSNNLTVSPGGDTPYESEDANRVADNVNDDSYALQRYGFGGQPRMLSGFDHSPQDTGGRLTPLLGDAQTHLKDHQPVRLVPRTSTDLTGGRKGGDSLPVQIGDFGSTAISYTILTGTDSSELGRYLRANADDGYWDAILPRLSASVDVGMALRARFKASSLTNLKALWSGDTTGYTDYSKADHFFGEWPVERRRELFAIGVDNLRDPLGRHGRGRPRGSVLADTNGQSAGFYTRSFPIMEKDGDPGVYGDDFYMHHNFVGNSELMWDYEDGYTWSGWLHLGSDAAHLRLPFVRILSETFKYNLAKGFYTGTGSTASTLFPITTTLSGTVGTADITYDIEYQWALTYRARLSLSDLAGGSPFIISDTGVLWINPRNSTTDIVEDIGGMRDRNTVTLAGDLQGHVGEDIESAMTDNNASLWLSKNNPNPNNNTPLSQTQMKDLSLFFDSQYLSGDHVENTSLYADAWPPAAGNYNANLGGVSISSVDTLVNRGGRSS